MQTMVLASALIKSRNGAARLDARELELAYSGPRHGLGDIARVAAVLAALALYAGVLAVAAQ